jgi:hypothetical protein
MSLDTWVLLIGLSGYLLVDSRFASFAGLGVLTPICMLYLAADWLGRTGRRRLRPLISRLKLVLLTLAAAFLLLVPAAEQIALRRVEGAHLHAQDGLIQTEEAVRFLLAGRNPYAEEYTGTPLEMAPFPRSPSPALVHLVYLPFTFLVHVPFALLGEQLVGWYDGRLLYAALTLLCLPLSTQLAVREERRLALVIAVGLNLPLIAFTVQGRNDVLGLFLVMASVALARRGRRSLSMVVMGLACAAKQTAWFGLPFYLLYLLGDEITWRSTKRLALQSWPFVLTVALVVGPFLLWDPGAFVDDTVTYLTGRSPTSYPLWGFGFGFLLRMVGLVGSENAYVPFWIPQIVVGLPMLVALLARQARRNGVRAFWLGFAATQLVLGYFSRIFQDNYLAAILSGFSLAFLAEEKEVRPEHQEP